MDEKDGACRELQAGYEKLQLEYKRQSRELMLLKRQLERSKVTAAAKDNMSRVVSAKRSELERYMNLLMENFPDIVLLLDSESRLVYCTDSFLRQSRIPAFGLVKGSRYRELLAGCAPEEFLMALDDAVCQISLEKHTVEFNREIDFSRDGNPRNYSVQISPMLSGDGNLEGIMIFFYDNTEIIRAQREAESANAAKSDFLATVSHEIRTPMNAIIGVAGILKSTELTPRQREYLESIQSSSHVLLNLINDILDFSKIEAGKLELVPEYFTLGNLLRHTRSMFALMFESKGLEFSCVFDPSLPEVVLGDENRIRQILTNLLNNAYKYTERGGALFRVQMEQSGQIRFDVEDTGIGIKAESIPSLFVAFKQLDIVRNKSISGTGLGLAITKRLCEMMDGSIEVRSVYGAGSRFTVLLPLEPGDESRLPSASHAETVEFTAPDARVLVVDDIEINLEITRHMLSGHRVTIDLALSGAQAVDMACKTAYDIIFMDHMMPEMDGVEATRIIRSMGGELETVPIVALTANAVSGAVTMFMENKFNDFISKPIDEAALNECLLRWLPKHKITVK